MKIRLLLVLLAVCFGRAAATAYLQHLYSRAGQDIIAKPLQSHA